MHLKQWILLTGAAGLLAVITVIMTACGGATPPPGDGEEEATEVSEEEVEPTPTLHGDPEVEATTAPTGVPTPIPPPEATPTLEVVDRIGALGAPTEEDQALYDLLGASDPPALDHIELAITLAGVDPADIPDPPTEPLKEYSVGDTETFWVKDDGGYSQVEAELILISRHAYFWQDVNVPAINRTLELASSSDWNDAGTSFDNAYETVRATFGEERSPGIDGDERVHILHSNLSGSVAGYLGTLDVLPPAVEEYTNAHEMFYMAAGVAETGVGGDGYVTTLVHEFQHLILNHLDPNEDIWMHEGLSELARRVAGYGDSPFTQLYAADTDRALWYLDGAPSYGYGYLVTAYLYERFGDAFVRALNANPTNSFAGIDETLAEVGYDGTFDDIFSDYMLAVYLNDTSIAGGNYGFRDTGVDVIETTAGFGTLPNSYVDDVSQYGFDVLRFRGDGGTATLTFNGAQSTMLIPANPHSGEMMWTPVRGDSSYSTLTQEFDLSDVESATLNYWTWFDIETGYDYAYVLVSTDNGETWTTQQSLLTTELDPNGANYGHGLTSRSGGASEAVWMPDSVDLSAYAGQTILLRFANFTDAGLTEDGIVIDDIEIPEIGFADDIESGPGGWEAEGWYLSHNRVPQFWSVRVALESQSGAITVQDLDVVDGVATLDINYDQVRTAIVFVSGQTRFTTQKAAYSLEVVPN